MSLTQLRRIFLIHYLIRDWGQFICPGCGSCYVGKTERTLYERTLEHGWNDPNSAVRTHIDNCDGVQFINAISHFPRLHTSPQRDDRSLHISTVQRNVVMIDQSDNWSVLLYKEALHIKQLKPALNQGLMASRDLQLFWYLCNSCTLFLYFENDLVILVEI